MVGPSSFHARGARVRYITVEASFASTHYDAKESSHLHGHSFNVAVTEMGSDAGVRDDLAPHLRDVLAELDLHNLDEMLVGGSQTLDGIGAWVMERLLINHPRITRVEVGQYDRPGVRVGITREIR
jgi:hypothetical protein